MTLALAIIETQASRRPIRGHRADHRARIEGWLAARSRAGMLVGGAEFEAESIAPITIRRDKGSVTVTEGPYAGEAETLGGCLPVEVADRDEAVRLAATWPTAERIKVRPVWVGARRSGRPAGAARRAGEWGGAAGVVAGEALGAAPAGVESGVRRTTTWSRGRSARRQRRETAGRNRPGRPAPRPKRRTP